MARAPWRRGPAWSLTRFLIMTVSPRPEWLWTFVVATRWMCFPGSRSMPSSIRPAWAATRWPARCRVIRVDGCWPIARCGGCATDGASGLDPAAIPKEQVLAQSAATAGAGSGAPPAGIQPVPGAEGVVADPDALARVGAVISDLRSAIRVGE